MFYSTVIQPFNTVVCVNVSVGNVNDGHILENLERRRMKEVTYKDEEWERRGMHIGYW
jgi:hypothetical protein